MTDFNLQYYTAGELVTKSQMNNLYQGKDQMLNGYFPIQPCIANGVAITQTATSNVFAFTAGQVRFIDQVNTNSSVVPQFTMSNIPEISSITITVGGTGSIPQYYIVALLTQTVVNSNNLTNTATILPNAMTLAEIASASIPAQYIPLYTITTADNTNYVIGTDSHCAYNYANSFPDIIDDRISGSVTIGGRVVGSTQTMAAMAANNNIATVAAYGNKGGGHTAGVFVGVYDTSMIPITGFAINDDARPYVTGNLTIVNQYNVAIIQDLPRITSYNALLIVKITPNLRSTTYGKYIVEVSGGLSLVVTGGVPSIPSIPISSFGGLSTVTEQNTGFLNIPNTKVAEGWNVSGYCVAAKGNNSINFQAFIPGLPDGSYPCEMNLLFCAD